MKILAFSSIRSDYDLLSPLYKLLHNDYDIDFKILVSGAHLSKSFGYSVEQINKDGFDILLKIETLLDSDTEISRLKSASLLLQNSLETIAKFNPDLMIYAGDREDVLIYAMIGGYLNIPTVHFFAGDHVQDGYIDNPIRHATSKLSTAHFVSLQEHRKRLIKMGESPKRIFVVGNISLDRLKNFNYISKEKIRNYFNLTNRFDKFALMIFHPITEEKENVDKYFRNILKILKQKNINTFVSYPNIDPGNQKLINVINEFKTDKNFVFYKNLERDIFISIYKHSQFIIGNSSSGICEAASFKIPAINVGTRQVGRYADKNVIFCSNDFQEIGDAINKACSKEFLDSLKDLKNSYEDGNGAMKAYKLIKQIDFKSMLAKKEDPLNMELI